MFNSLFVVVLVFVLNTVFDVAITASGRGPVGGIYSHLLHIFVSNTVSIFVFVCVFYTVFNVAI